MFNPFLLLKSGLDGPLVGRRLHEQGAVDAIVHLDGVDNFRAARRSPGTAICCTMAPTAAGMQAA
jgi:hypothetical protein